MGQYGRQRIDFCRATRRSLPSDSERAHPDGSERAGTERLAEVFGSTHTLAVIGREESVNRLAETVAQNRGVALRVFFTEREALTWLLPAANPQSRLTSGGGARIDPHGRF